MIDQRIDPNRSRGQAPVMVPWLCALVLVGLVASVRDVWAHGGEDHDHPAVAAPSAVAAGTLTTFGVSPRYELLMKYEATEADHPVTVRLFLCDFATNRPVEGALFVFASKPAGARSIEAPRMTSPGVYQATMTFPNDTVYSLTATFSVGDQSETIALPAVYAGEAAEHILGQHTESSANGAGLGGLWWPIAIGAGALVAVAVWLARRARKPSGGNNGPTFNNQQGSGV